MKLMGRRDTQSLVARKKYFFSNRTKQKQNPSKLLTFFLLKCQSKILFTITSIQSLQYVQIVLICLCVQTKAQQNYQKALYCSWTIFCVKWTYTQGEWVVEPYLTIDSASSQCSRSCGGGTQSRNVICMNNKGEHLDGCGTRDRPPHWQRCKNNPCPTAEGSHEVRPKNCKDIYSKSVCLYVIQANFCQYTHYGKMCCDSCGKRRKHQLY